MLVSLREYHRDIDVSDILVTKENEGQAAALANRYLVTRVEPTIEIARIKLAKANMYVLAEHSIEHDNISGLLNGEWYIEVDSQQP